MQPLRTLICALALSALSSVSVADDYSYAAIAKRFPDMQLQDANVREMKMQGECLVGLKELNFQRRDDFDPVAEWTNYRAMSLLDQFAPCSVLIMIEVAREKLIEQE